MEESSSDWLDQAWLTLITAEALLVGGEAGEGISNAFLAMLYASRAALEDRKGGILDWEEVMRRFQGEALPGLSLSKENQRALPIVADLYRRVSGGEMEPDPVTAAACLEDARSFIGEIEAKI